MRRAFAIAILVFQVGAIVYSRFTPARYFCWAPFDAQNDFTIEARLNGRELTAEEIRARYKRPQRGVDNRSIQHVKDILRGAETIYAGEPAEVVLRYRTNGGEEQVWNWPPR